MILYAQNLKELEGIVIVMNKLGERFRVYRAGYTALEKITYNDGNTDEFELLKNGHLVVSSCNDNDMSSKVFDAVAKECVLKNSEIEVDRECGTICLYAGSGRASKTFYNFWCGSELPNNYVDSLTNNTFSYI